MVPPAIILSTARPSSSSGDSTNRLVIFFVLFGGLVFGSTVLLCNDSWLSPCSLTDGKSGSIPSPICGNQEAGPSRGCVVAPRGIPVGTITAHAEHAQRSSPGGPLFMHADVP